MEAIAVWQIAKGGISHPAIKFSNTVINFFNAAIKLCNTLINFSDMVIELYLYSDQIRQFLRPRLHGKGLTSGRKFHRNSNVTEP